MVCFVNGLVLYF
jgi:hypothetical protein